MNTIRKTVPERPRPTDLRMPDPHILPFQIKKAILLPKENGLFYGNIFESKSKKLSKTAKSVSKISKKFQ